MHVVFQSTLMTTFGFLTHEKSLGCWQPRSSFYLVFPSYNKVGCCSKYFWNSRSQTVHWIMQAICLLLCILVGTCYEYMNIPDPLIYRFWLCSKWLFSVQCSKNFSHLSSASIVRMGAVWSSSPLIINVTLVTFRVTGLAECILVQISIKITIS